MQEDFFFGRRLWRGARLTGRADTEPPVEEKVWLRGARPYPGFGMCRRELTTGFKSVNRQYYWLVSTGIMESFIPIRMPNVRQKIRFIKGGRKIKRKKMEKKVRKTHILCIIKIITKVVSLFRSCTRLNHRGISLYSVILYTFYLASRTRGSKFIFDDLPFKGRHRKENRRRWKRKKREREREKKVKKSYYCVKISSTLFVRILISSFVDLFISYLHGKMVGNVPDVQSAQALFLVQYCARYHVRVCTTKKD